MPRSLVASAQNTRLRCERCSAEYWVSGGIPDLRVDRPAWIDVDEDREAAARLDRDFASKSLEDMVRAVFAAQPGRSQQQIDTRTRQVLVAPSRLATQLDGWLRGVTQTPGFLDLGCGPGMLLAAAAERGVSGLGIDVSLTWLVVARRMIEEHGGRGDAVRRVRRIAAAARREVPAIVSLDVIEHVADQPRYLAEIDRIAADGADDRAGHAEPVQPRRRAARARVGRGLGARPLSGALRARAVRPPYEYVRLLSVPGLERLLRAAYATSPDASSCLTSRTTRSTSYSARRAALARAVQSHRRRGRCCDGHSSPSARSSATRARGVRASPTRAIKLRNALRRRRRRHESRHDVRARDIVTPSRKSRSRIRHINRHESRVDFAHRASSSCGRARHSSRRSFIAHPLT